MTTTLGTFGEAHEDMAETFDYFTIEIRVNPTLSELDILDFMESVAAADEDDPSSALVVKGFLRSLIHVDDFDLFWLTAKAHRQRVDDLQRVTKAIVEAVTARPTQQPSDSPTGRPATRRKSKVASSSRVLHRLAGRPDLQLAVVKAQQAQRAG